MDVKIFPENFPKVVLDSYRKVRILFHVRIWYYKAL